MNALVVVPCGASKRSTTALARHMYLGGYHRACMAWAQSTFPQRSIMILSAKYGLLALDSKIEPYDMKMGDQGCVTAQDVKRQADELGLLNASPVVALGGSRYVAIVRAIWPEALTPLAGVGGMGRQISVLIRNRNRMPNDWMR